MDKRNTNGHAANGVTGSRTRDVIHLSLCDALPAYGPITGLSFSVARNGVRDRFKLLCGVLLLTVGMAVYLVVGTTCR